MSGISLPFLWFLFASFAVAGSLVYNVGMKLGGNVNVFSFTLIACFVSTALQAIIFSIAKFGFNMDMAEGMNSRTILIGATVGASMVLVDVSCFLALRMGTLTQLQCYWTIGSVIALVIVSFFFFKEPMPPMKIVGIALGIVSLFLVIGS
jgi:multidrug transporter EmrE-like cation transporter